MRQLNCTLIGAPVETGASQAGCIMGPDGFRTAGITTALASLGHTVRDIGNVAIGAAPDPVHPNDAIRALGPTIAWGAALQKAAQQSVTETDFPIFLGGDHSIAIGTIPGMAARAAARDRPLFVLWLDAHPDIHTLDTTESGNLHGTPVAYFTGAPGFDGIYPDLPATIAPENICMMGIRSVDPAENAHLGRVAIEVHDMRAIDESGVATPIRAFLGRVREAGGDLHVSLDVDFLDPDIAPGVGTTVPGGATFREAHLIMELLCDSGLVTSLDLVELNPFLDERGRTAHLMVDLCASLLGRKVLDRPTQSL